MNVKSLVFKFEQLSQNAIKAQDPEAYGCKMHAYWPNLYDKEACIRALISEPEVRRLKGLIPAGAFGYNDDDGGMGGIDCVRRLGADTVHYMYIDSSSTCIYPDSVVRNWEHVASFIGNLPHIGDGTRIKQMKVAYDKICKV